MFLEFSSIRFVSGSSATDVKIPLDFSKSSWYFICYKKHEYDTIFLILWKWLNLRCFGI